MPNRTQAVQLTNQVRHSCLICKTSPHVSSLFTAKKRMETKTAISPKTRGEHVQNRHQSAHRQLLRNRHWSTHHQHLQKRPKKAQNPARRVRGHWSRWTPVSNACSLPCSTLSSYATSFFSPFLISILFPFLQNIYFFSINLTYYINLVYLYDKILTYIKHYSSPGER